jgi:hypothetical protein
MYDGRRCLCRTLSLLLLFLSVWISRLDRIRYCIVHMIFHTPAQMSGVHTHFAIELNAWIGTGRVVLVCNEAVKLACFVEKRNG